MSLSTSEADTKENKIKEAIKNSCSKADAIKALGLSGKGGNYKVLNNFVKKNKIDVSHWTGKEQVKRRPAGSRLIKTKDLLVEGSTFQTFKLKQRLLSENLIENKCFICGIETWNGKKISLHLDHINGVSDDHRLENLRMLCPNCHSQTDTYCAKNKEIKFEISQNDLDKIKSKSMTLKDASKQYKVSIRTFKKRLAKQQPEMPVLKD